MNLERPDWNGREAADRASQVGVHQFVLGGIGPDEWVTQFEWHQGDPARFFPVIGLHPVWVAEHTPQELDAGLTSLENHLSRAPSLGIRALGELGLDARKPYRTSEAWALQENAFEAQLRLAQKFQLPLVLHIVRAHTRALEILERLAQPPGWSGIVHSFGGGLSEARAYAALGLHLSLSGGAIRSGVSAGLQEALLSLPKTTWVLETDSPDQKFEEGVGPWNEPAQILKIAEKLGPFLGLSGPEFLGLASRQARQIFHLPG